MIRGDSTGDRQNGSRSLVAEGVEVDFGGLVALCDVSLRIEQGAILGLIGPNGAGKTTLLNVFSGFQGVTRGKIRLGDRDITRWSAERRARSGIARTFQSVRLFSRLTVLDNVLVGAFNSIRSTPEARRHAHELLDLLSLSDCADDLAESLPYGKERRLGIARALATGPRFLLLDEPAAGLNELETDELLEAIRRIRDSAGCGVIVIEHDMRLIMGLCEEIQVLDHGRPISYGKPDEVRSDPVVIEAYLGAASA